MWPVTADSTRWLPRLSPPSRPLYRSIADAIADDIAMGRLAPGDRLPPQRQLAERLDIDFTTVTRAYNEARRRGLIAGRVGSGSYVCAVSPEQAASRLAHRRGLDMTMNLPPEPVEASLLAQMEAAVDALKPRLAALLRYQAFGGAPAEREAGASWLARHWPGVPAERLLLCPGAQSVLVSLLTLLKANEPGALVCCESLTYPGLRAAAAQLGVELHGLPMDEEGIEPRALAALCAERAPRALYCNPTLHNPTSATMSPARRADIAEIARRYRLPIIEDDAYALLPREPVAPLASYAPELTWYVAGLAKCLGAGLRLAYVVAPQVEEARRLAGAMRASTIMASPLTAALATEWIRSGTAERRLTSIREETRARHALALEWLGSGAGRSRKLQSSPDAFHLWLGLPPHWNRAAFAHRLGDFGISLVPSDAFTVSRLPPEAMRISLGGAIDRRSLVSALADIARTLESQPEQNVSVV